MTRVVDERPFLTVKQFSDPKLIQWGIEIENFGKTPALHVRLHCHVIEGKPINWDMPDDPDILRWGKLPYLIPNEAVPLSCVYYGKSEDKYYFTRYGYIEYEDESLHHHQTPFCFRMSSSEHVPLPCNEGFDYNHGFPPLE